MAERRMFAKTIIDSDAFLDMSLTAQALYFHLSMRADDDGFINNPKKVQRMIGASDDDFRILIAKSFLIPFQSGIVVIKHWRIHNYIQADRYKETVYTEEKSLLTIKKNKAYTYNLPEENSQCIQNGYMMDTQVRLGKVSIGKDSIGEIQEGDKAPKSKAKRFTPPTREEVQAYCKERNNNVDAKKFYDYYDTANWYDGKGEKVKNWKQKVITWEMNAKPIASEQQSSNPFLRLLEEGAFDE